MLLDTSAWVEYFKGTKEGEKVKSIIKNNVIYICPITIAELSNWCYKNNKDPVEYIKIIKNLSTYLELSEEILNLSGKIYYRLRKKNKKIGLIDCIIYTTAQIHGLELITKDNDFKNLPGVQLL